MDNRHADTLQPLLLAACGGALVLGLFLTCASLAVPAGVTAPPHPDSLQFMQYARAIAEGHPYRYVAGDAPSTGSTSHLYPLLLAIPYALGAHGEALGACSLALQAACFLALVVLAGLAARRLAPGAAPLAAWLTAVCGPLVFTCLQQSDMGVFAVLALGFFAALLHRRHVLAGALLTLAVWCRPEGMLMAASVLLCGLLATRETGRRIYLRLGSWGVIQAAAVLILNHALTGRLAFDSIACKGYFHQQPFLGAARLTAGSLASLFQGFTLNLSSTGRELYAVPLAAGLCMLIGLALRVAGPPIRAATPTRWWLLTWLGGMTLTAMGGWQGYAHDRHLAWMFPFLAIFAAAGLQDLASAWPRPRVWLLAGIGLAGYQAVLLPYFASEHAEVAQRTAAHSRFIASMHTALPPEKRIGLMNYPGAAWDMPGRHVTHVGGYVSPAFVTADAFASNIEILRHRRDLRFDYWLLVPDEMRLPLVAPLLGSCVAQEQPCFPKAAGMVLHAADWSTLSAPIEPLSPGAVQAVRGLNRTDRLDVGYGADEASHGYRLRGEPPQTRLRASVTTRTIAGQPVTEAARAVLGSETFHIRATPGQPVRIVLRTASRLSADVRCFDETFAGHDLAFEAASRVAVSVDDGEPLLYVLPLGTNDAAWSEAVLDLPAAAIRRPDPAITVAGEHIAACYWFYQPASGN
ncbi:MAG: hypothetical protein WCI17_11540 [bacterium]